MFFALHATGIMLVAFYATYYLIPLCTAIAHKLRILDNPDGKLKLQREPVPYLGGLAVYGGFVTALALFFPLAHQEFLLLFVGITLLLFVGLIDDIVALRPWQKFLGQMIVAVAFMKAGFYLKGNFFEATTFFEAWFWKIISFFWFLTIINAFNLVDVMDGLSSTIALCAAGGFLAIALSFGLTSVSLLLCAFMGSLFAFFLVNRPPSAKMYLGDAGSLFLGGFLATVPFMIPWGRYNYVGVLAALAILLIPLLEVTGLIVIRTYKKIPFYLGSPHHFSLLLRKKGFLKGRILVLVALLGLALNSIAFCFAHYIISLFSFIILLGMAVFGWIFLMIWLLLF